MENNYLYLFFRMLKTFDFPFHLKGAALQTDLISGSATCETTEESHFKSV